MEPKVNQALGLLGFLAAVVAAALFGSLSTISASDQYAELEQPGWAPPSWLFGPAWSFLYLAIAVAGWLVWRETGLKSRPIALWSGQLAVNALWSPLFFAMGWRGLALAWILLLDGLVIVTIVSFWRNRIAAYLMMPYMAWILFATCLNASVWWLNR